MTYQRVLVKDHARAAIKGKKPCRRALAYSLLSLLFSFVALLPFLIGSLVSLPRSAVPSAGGLALFSGFPLPFWLCLGATLLLAPTAHALLWTGGCAYCLDLWRGRGTDSSRFWAGFSRFPTVMALGLMVVFYSLLWSLPYSLLSLLVMVFLSPLLSVELATAAQAVELFPFLAKLTPPGPLVLVLLGVAALLFLVLYCNRVLGYVLSFFVLLDHPRFSARQCLNASKALMRGRKGKLVVLLLSFLGWALLSDLLGVAAQLLAPILRVFFPAAALPGAAFWCLRLMLIFYLFLLIAAVLLLPLWLMNYMGVSFAGFYDFALADDFNRPTPPRSWQVYG